MGTSLIAFLAMFLLVLVVNGRSEPKEYWKGIMKDEPMPEVIQGIIIPAQGFKPMPRNPFWIYEEQEKTSAKEFKPTRNSFWIYEDQEKTSVEEFKPTRNSFWIYEDEKTSVKDDKVSSDLAQAKTRY